MKDYEKLTKEHFDGMAERYAATDGTYFSPLPKACCDAASEVLEETGFSHLLDVGCGSGYLLHKLAKSHKAEFFGLDLSPKMLFEAKKRLSAFDNVRLSEVLPNYVCDTLKAAIADMDRRLKGFACPDALLTAPETRFSSPVRILRGEDGESVSVRGVYPCGEGCGYSGGITSSAADGLRIAEKIRLKYSDLAR